MSLQPGDRFVFVETGFDFFTEHGTVVESPGEGVVRLAFDDGSFLDTGPEKLDEFVLSEGTCLDCGCVNEGTAKFCGSCGDDLTEVMRPGMSVRIQGDVHSGKTGKIMGWDQHKVNGRNIPEMPGKYKPSTRMEPTRSAAVQLASGEKVSVLKRHLRVELPQ